MPAYQLSPACKDYLWGGHHHLHNEFGVSSPMNPLAEAWVLSCHPDGPSILTNGPYAGRTLSWYLDWEGRRMLGNNCREFDCFPLLIKLIDAEEPLSIQVHPSDEYALAHEGQLGKTEMWVVLEAEPGGFIYYGFERPVTREEFARRIGDGTLTEVLHKAPAKAGDVFFIPSGTLHAIGKGLVIAEIQQNSNVTYRVFDYDRKGPDGQKRPLHVEKALEVTDLRPVKPMAFGPHLGSCPYFTVDRKLGSFQAVCGEETFQALLIAEGEGKAACGTEIRTVKKGDCLFLPAGSGAYWVEGNCETLITYIS